jgi:hypothetical protein
MPVPAIQFQVQLNSGDISFWVECRLHIVAIVCATDTSKTEDAGDIAFAITLFVYDRVGMPHIEDMSLPFRETLPHEWVPRRLECDLQGARWDLRWELNRGGEISFFWPDAHFSIAARVDISYCHFIYHHPVLFCLSMDLQPQRLFRVLGPFFTRHITAIQQKVPPAPSRLNTAMIFHCGSRNGSQGHSRNCGWR